MANISKYNAQKRISLTWFILSILLVIVFISVVWSRRGEQFPEIMEWLINYLSPGLVLIIGSFTNISLQAEKYRSIMSNGFVVNATTGLSAIFLLTLMGISISAAFAINGTDMLLLDFLKQFNVLLTFLHGLAMLLLGIFFTRDH